MHIGFHKQKVAQAKLGLLICLGLMALTGCTATGGAPVQPAPAVQQVIQAQVSTVAGTGAFGYAEGKPGQFYHPSSVVVMPDNSYLMVDRYNLRIRKITEDGETSTFWASSERGNREGAEGTGLFNLPIALMRLASGELLIADAQNNTIRSLKDGVLSTFAGGGGGFADGPLADARFAWPGDLASDGKGTVYVADRDNHAIRKISPDGTVSTLAGNGAADYQEGTGKNARFSSPVGLALGPDGNLYVADSGNNVIRKVTPAGEVSTFAGSGQPGSREDSRLKAEFRQPAGLVFGADGSLYVSDRFNHRIRRIGPDGMVSSVAGNGQPSYKNGLGSEAGFSYPYGLALDAKGNLLVADYGNHALRRIVLGGVKTGPVDINQLQG